MLDDHDRAKLHEIQRQLLAEDPRFVQAFDGRTQRPPIAALDQPVDEYRLSLTILMWTLR